MSSSADCVFAIPEILEHILLFIDPTTRNLYQLQTINRSFHHAINGSSPLLRTMEILHKLPEQKKFRVCNPYLELQQLAFPVEFYRPVVLAPASPRNSGEGWKLEIYVTIYLDESGTVPDKQIGVKSSKSFTNPLDGSWRRMKVARFPVVIEVHLEVRDEVIGARMYPEITADPSGEMTLGDVAEIIEGVNARSEEEHRGMAIQFLSRRQAGREVGTRGGVT